jgi:hypothetical protein
MQWTLPSRCEIAYRIALGKIGQFIAYLGIVRLVLDTLHSAFCLVPVAGDQYYLPFVVSRQSLGDGLTNGACGTRD